LAEAEKQVLTQEGLEKQHEIWLQALKDAAAASQRELDSILERNQKDREQYTALKAQLQVFDKELAQTRLEIAALEGSQTDADQQVARVTEAMNGIRQETAALEAERLTAQGHVADLRVLQTAAEGERDRKLADIDGIHAEIDLLEEQIRQQQARKTENAAEIDTVRQNMQAAMNLYAETEAQKSRAESEIQEKNKSMINMERACALLENKKETTAIEERNTIDKLWDTYGLTPGTAAEKRGENELQIWVLDKGNEIIKGTATVV